MRTLPLAISLLQETESTNLTMMMTGAVIASIPLVIVFIIFQKYLIKGVKIGNRGL